MASAIEQGIEILREDGPVSFVRDAAAYLRREQSRKYAAKQFDPDAPTCRVMDEDWDNLIILDACRLDQFERLNDVPGRLESRTSLGSCTPEFLEGNFAGTAHYDTVYVTANPMYRQTTLESVFHDVVDVWESDWDDGNHTVRPGKMIEAVTEAYEDYPDKRIIAHFVQPHYPFIGNSARELEAEAGDEFTGIEWIDEGDDGPSMEDRATPWDLLEAGELDERAVREAYDENLALALPYVEELVSRFDEKTVVTSDHGNLLGKRIAPFGKPVYGHPPKTPVEELRAVPWLVVEGERRKQVRAESPEADEGATSGVVADRLADLGYAEA